MALRKQIFKHGQKIAVRIFELVSMYTISISERLQPLSRSRARLTLIIKGLKGVRLNGGV